MTDDSPAPERLAYTVEEAAETLGLSRSGLYKLIAAGEIATVKFGAGKSASRRITPDAIREFLAAKAAS